jgi:hypothetical protein
VIGIERAADTADEVAHEEACLGCNTHSGNASSLLGWNAVGTEHPPRVSLLSVDESAPHCPTR